MLTSLLAITLGVTAMVASQHITISSERKNAREMESLGANVLVVPPGVTLRDYYSADSHGYTLPDEYVSRLALARMPSVETLVPKLSVESNVNSIPVTITGILPRSELHAKPGGQSLGPVRSVGRSDCCCATKANVDGEVNDPKSLATSRTIQNLGDREVILGNYLAAKLGVNVGDDLPILGESFAVLAVLPSTGTTDDSRLFAHLLSVQELSGTGPFVNSIEIMACCDNALGSLITNLSAELPDSGIITIGELVQTQVAINGLVSRLSWVLFSILMVFGGMSLIHNMYGNVTERRKEISTLIALGASRSFVAQMFLGKAMLLGLAGGLGAFVVGTPIAAIVGQQLLGVTVQPMPNLLAVSIVCATVVAVAASFLPARYAAALDPCLAFNEEVAHSHQRG